MIIPDASRAMEPQQRPVSSAYANYVLGVLFVVYVFNFIDRQVLAILIGPIQQELDVSDTAMGFLVGFMNDRLSGSYGAEAIRYSLLLVALISASASLFFWLSGSTLREDLALRRDRL